MRLIFREDSVLLIDAKNGPAASYTSRLRPQYHRKVQQSASRLSAEAASKWGEHSDKMLCSRTNWKSQDMWHTGVSLYCSFTGSGNASKYATQLLRTLGSSITGCWDVCVGGTRLCSWAVFILLLDCWECLAQRRSLLADTIPESCITHFTPHTYLAVFHYSPFFLTPICCSLLLWQLSSCSPLAAHWLAYCFLIWILCKGFTQVVHFMDYYYARDLQDSLSLFCFTFAQVLLPEEAFLI